LIQSTMNCTTTITIICKAFAKRKKELSLNQGTNPLILFVKPGINQVNLLSYFNIAYYLLLLFIIF